ncbi:hypothetical protein NC651_014563 [Populus alba x Populus x berolinensis]|nr:hypothetical protein NC651_014563 [Populus alba x Populus x berolinensis]
MVTTMKMKGCSLVVEQGLLEF